MKESVKQLRRDIVLKQLNVMPNPGYYIWWFDEQGMKQILKPLKGVNYDSIASQKIGGKDYYALYFGISKDLKGRFRWHIAQKHSMSAVKSGFLSTLRKTLSGLLGIAMIDSESAVNTFIDKHCWLEYDYCQTYAVAVQKEKEALKKGYFPLNIQNNKGVEKAVVAELLKVRKHYRWIGIK